MKESYGKGLATHAGHESCLDDPQGRGEALTVERAGGLLSSEITTSGCRPRALMGTATSGVALQGERRRNPAEPENLACADTLCAGIGRPGACPHRRQLMKAQC